MNTITKTLIFNVSLALLGGAGAAMADSGTNGEPALDREQVQVQAREREQMARELGEQMQTRAREHGNEMAGKDQASGEALRHHADNARNTAAGQMGGEMQNRAREYGNEMETAGRDFGDRMQSTSRQQAQQYRNQARQQAMRNPGMGNARGGMMQRPMGGAGRMR